MIPLWEVIRREIQLDLGQPDLTIEDRVLAAFERTDDTSDAGHPATSGALLASALRSQPSLGPALAAAGVDVPALVEALPNTQVAYPPLFYESEGIQGLYHTLQVCLLAPGSDQPNEAFECAIERGVLRLEDLIVGALETRTLDDRFVTTLTAPNDITTALLDASGRNWSLPLSPDVEELFRNLVGAFEASRRHEPHLGDEQLLLHLDAKDQVRVRRSAFYSVSTAEGLPGAAFAVTTSSKTEEPLEHLEYLVNRFAPEKEFQAFFERYPQFLLTMKSGWLEARPHLVIHRDEVEGGLIPDFVLERIDGFTDLLELKRPDTRIVVRKRNRHRLSLVINDAVAQLRTYAAALEDDAVRQEFTRAGRFLHYRPRLVIVAGRSSAFTDGMDRRRLLSLLPAEVDLYTFDDVIERARLWLPRLLRE